MSTDEEPTQFKITDVTVPPGFLRTEYMMVYTFMGLMYGLGFLVLFQSILIPWTKIIVAILYVWLLKLDVIHPVKAQDALQQVPPQ